MYIFSITHNKNIHPSLNLLINGISARSTPQKLSIEGDCTFLLWNFIIIDLCNSSANSLFKLFSFLIPLPETFLSKKLETIEAIPRCIHHIFDFYQY